MAQQFDNELRGSMFRNDRKTKDNQPDYKGSCQIEGVEYWMSAWVREGKSGPFLSISYQLKEQRCTGAAVDDVLRPTRAAADSAPRQPAPKSSIMDNSYEDDIPF